MIANRMTTGLGILFALAAASCGDSTGTGGHGGAASAEGGGGSGGSPPAVELRIDPSSAVAEVDILTGAEPITFQAFAVVAGAPEEDVTLEAEWSLDAQAMGSVTDGTFQPAKVGGVTKVNADFMEATASADLTLKLVGDVVMPGDDPTLPDQFASATEDPTPENAPALEYPEDGVVLPGNIPPIEAQWSLGSDNAAYRVHLTAGAVLDVSFYTSSRELAFPPDLWASLRETAPDEPIRIEVEGLGAGGQRRLGAPRTMTISADGIDDSAIYVWQSSTGSFRVLDIIAGTDIALPTDSPALAPGQPCSGCHRISRDGKRFAYSFNGAGFQIGTLAYDAGSMTFQSKVAPAAGVRGTYATFNPLEDTTEAAMLLTVPDDVAQNAPGTTRLEIVDPDTNQPLGSNLADALTTVGMPSTLMPDWSPDGSFVVFIAYDSAANYVREIGDDVVNASIVEMSVSYSAATQSFTFGDAKVLVQAAGGNPDTAENDFLPTISPDGTAVAFTRSSGWWSLKTQSSLLNLSGQIALVRRSDEAVIELVKGSNGPGTQLSSTWPQWAPTVGDKYMWLAYASERPYGHRLTTASPENAQCSLVQGQRQCKQLWVMAIDRAALAAGSEDPSAAPFWIPGQTLSAQYVSPQWTKAVIPPPQ